MLSDQVSPLSVSTLLETPHRHSSAQAIATLGQRIRTSCTRTYATRDNIYLVVIHHEDSLASGHRQMALMDLFARDQFFALGCFRAPNSDFSWYLVIPSNIGDEAFEEATIFYRTIKALMMGPFIVNWLTS